MALLVCLNRFIASYFNFLSLYSGYFIIFVAFGFLLISELTSCNDDVHPVTGEIIIGDYNSIYVDSTIKTIEAHYNNYEDILLDVDLNGTADLRLLVAMWGSPGMGVHYVSEIQTLNSNIALFGVFIVDTTFLNRIISIFSDDYNIYKTITDYHSCRRKSQTDIVTDYVTAFHALDLKYHDKMNLADVFSSGTVSFIYHEAYPGIPDVQNDTVVIHSIYYESDCHSLPLGTEIYLGFRLIAAREYLGWVRLILQEPARITLKEFAVQGNL